MGANDERLDRIVESLQQINVHLEGLRVSLTSLVQDSEDHETRIRAVERWQSNLTPILAFLTFVLGAVFTEMLGRFI